MSGVWCPRFSVFPCHGRFRGRYNDSSIAHQVPDLIGARSASVWERRGAPERFPGIARKSCAALGSRFMGGRI